MSRHLFWDFASGVSDAGCQSGLLVAGSRIKSGQLEAERGIIQIEVRWPTDSLGRMGTSKQKWPGHSWPWPNQPHGVSTAKTLLLFHSLLGH